MKHITALLTLILTTILSVNAIVRPETDNYLKFVTNNADRTAEITGHYDSWAGTPIPSDFVLPSYHIPSYNETNYSVIGFYGNGVFRECTQIRSIAIPTNQYKSIPSTTFIDCENLKKFSWAQGSSEGRSGDYYIEDGVLYSLYAYFASTYGIWKMFCYPAGKSESESEFQIPTKCNSIGEYCFYKQRHLESISFHDKIKKIEKYSFYGCEKLLSVTIPASVANISEGAFANCTNLKNLTIENGVETIGSEAFANCVALETIIIPSSVTQIEERAFAGCSNLKTIILQSGIRTFGTDAFYGCNLLNEVRIVDLSGWCQSDFATPLANPAYLSKKINFIGDIINDLTIPSTATHIGQNAFYGYTPLKSVTVHNNLSSIAKDAFAECNNIVEINISSLESWCNIEFTSEKSNPLIYGKFLSLDGILLDILNIPEGIEKIKQNAFVNGHFTQILVPSSVNEIADAAFKGISPNSVYCYGITPPVISSTAFSDYSATLFVPMDSKSSYWVHNVWGRFTDIKSIPIEAISISLDKQEYEMNVHDTLTLNVVFNPIETTDKKITWSSSDESIALVQDGVVTALKKGNAIINATTNNNKSASCRLTINDVLANDIIILPTKVTLRPGDSTLLAVILLPENTTNKLLNWHSDNSNIATISQDGIVKAISEGYAQITVTTLDGSNLSATCHVSVLSLKVSSISLNPSSVTGKVGDQIQIESTILPENATNKVLAWRSSDENVASVDGNGIVSLLMEGTATITASATDGSGVNATCNISISKPNILVSSISLNPSSAEGKEGEQIQINASVFPEDATNKALAWHSSDESVATVDNSGIISLVKKGSAVITASATDDSGISAECTVVVSEYSGIADILTDKNTYVKIFNLNGILVYEGLYSEANLISDYYIVVCDGKNIKVKVE